jgi:dimethylargininase
MMRAVVRGIPDTFQSATVMVRSSDAIDVELARRQHGAYVAALRRLDVAVTELPGDPAFPDCCFVEDCIVQADGTGVITALGEPSRRGEERAIDDFFQTHTTLGRMQLPATADGGDCLRVDKRIYVGLSLRTNEGGLERIREAFAPRGFEVVGVPVTDVLHLKCVCSYLGRGKLLLADGYVPPETFRDVEIVSIPKEESYAANAVAIGDVVLLADGHPAARRAVERAGFQVVPLATSEIAKADGSLTCLSVRF